MLIQVLIDVVFWTLEHWREITVFGVLQYFLIALARKNAAQQIKRLFGFDDKREVREYIANQQRIEKKIDLLLKERGLSWNATISKPLEANIQSESSKRFILSRMGLYIVRFVGKIMNLRRKIKMKQYLKKLGRTKFQALLVSLVVNLVSAVLFFTGRLDIDEVVNQWMPIINMTVATISTWVYIAVEGSIDKANVEGAKNNVDYSASDHVSE